jgi:hypothetical protein
MTCDLTAEIFTNEEAARAHFQTLRTAEPLTKQPN